MDGYDNFTGGIKKGSAFVALLDANVNLNLEKLIDLKSGSFYLDFEYHGGDNPTSTFVGDFQVFDKNNADPFFEALELWYQHILFNNKLSAGLHVPERFELNYVAYYQFAISNGINLKPDIQYIVHPGGIYRNALASTLMLNFAFPSDNEN